MDAIFKSIIEIPALGSWLFHVSQCRGCRSPRLKSFQWLETWEAGRGGSPRPGRRRGWRPGRWCSRRRGGRGRSQERCSQGRWGWRAAGASETEDPQSCWTPAVQDWDWNCVLSYPRSSEKRRIAADWARPRENFEMGRSLMRSHWTGLTRGRGPAAAGSWWTGWIWRAGGQSSWP